MLVWINGAFGAGKTTAALGLAKRWPAALFFDPEQVGFLLRRVVPVDRQGDFQELRLWRQLTTQTVAGLIEQHHRPLIVPMTLVDLGYFDEVVGELRRGGVDVRHFTLLASPATLRRRLLWRRPLLARRRWAMAQIDRCAQALAAPEFAQHLQTDHRRPREIVDEILAALPNPLPGPAGLRL